MYISGQKSLNLDIEFMLISHSTLLQYIAIKSIMGLKPFSSRIPI